VATSALAQALVFTRLIDERASTRIERLPFGSAYFHERLPDVWHRNYVALDAPPDGEDLPAVLAEVDAVQGAAGLAHRKLLIEDETAGDRLSPLLVAAGWDIARLGLMAHRGAAASGAAAAAREVDLETLRPTREEFIRLDPFSARDSVVEQLLEADHVIAAAVTARPFASFEDGEIAAFCFLYSDGATAQIEVVSTLPRFRRRGHARAVVEAALAAALEDHDLTFIVADEGDWVKDWYARLGFERVGIVHEALRRP
jgi:ribosomal protein S18 acetylase RimI-like enzyme